MNDIFLFYRSFADQKSFNCSGVFKIHRCGASNAEDRNVRDGAFSVRARAYRQRSLISGKCGRKEKGTKGRRKNEKESKRKIPSTITKGVKIYAKGVESRETAVEGQGKDLLKLFPDGFSRISPLRSPEARRIIIRDPSCGTTPVNYIYIRATDNVTRPAMTTSKKKKTNRRFRGGAKENRRYYLQVLMRHLLSSLWPKIERRCYNTSPRYHIHQISLLAIFKIKKCIKGNTF